MLPPLEKIVLALLVLATAVLFGLPFLRRLRIIRAGRPAATGGTRRPASRALGKIFLQRCTLRDERVATGVMHALIFYGALTFDTFTLNHTLEGFVPGFFMFGNGLVGHAFSFLIDLFAITVMIGVVFFAFRRFVVRPQAYRTTRGDSAIIYALITLATVTYLYFEAFSILHHPETARWGFLGKALAGWIGGSGLTAAAIGGHFRAAWWLHTIAVFGFIAYVPHSKYLHMFMGPINVFARREEPTGALAPLDLEHSETFGVAKASDFRWTDNLDAFACVECGRCQDACPAFASDKPLSPKMLLVNQEKALLAQDKPLVAKAADALPALVPATFTPDEIWSCTTCGACMHVCPVEVRHIPKIVGLRQSEVLMESRFPQELNAFFRNLETNGNPWGIGFAKRAEWTEGLDVPLIGDAAGAEVLFWVGCMGSHDDEGRKIARAMVSLMRKAGVRFGILGPEEKCCGDSARRLGNEYLFQTLAAANLDAFKEHGVKTIVTICPHGYNTFKHEYPALLDLLPSLSAGEKERLRAIEVVSHAEFLSGLVASGRLRPRRADGAAYTFHDSCYYARHNGLVAEPRAVLDAALAGPRVEMRDHDEHGFCCGAGGGLMWTEEKLGRRVNHLRTEQVLATGAPMAASSCPFCLTMLRDGLKDKDRADVAVRDIAQILDEAC